VLARHAEAVGEACGDEELSAVLGAELDHHVSAEGRRALAHVERDVDDGPLEHLDQLRLRPRVLKVKATQDAPRGARHVVLDEVARDAGGAIALGVKALEEEASRVAEHLGLDDQHARERRLDHVHALRDSASWKPIEARVGANLGVASEGPRSPTSRASRSSGKVRGVKVVVLGANGQVGHELVGALAPCAEVTALGRRGGDLADLDGLRETLRALRPDAVVNAASYNDVDAAEREPHAALCVNRDAVELLGREALHLRFALVHYSTDFVFDGRGKRPYVETDEPSPLGAYGRSKLAGERALEALGAPAIVFRTAWVYSLRRKSFVSTMLKLGRSRPHLRVVSDQVGSPTFCRDLAVATALVLHRHRDGAFDAFLEARGIYHLAGSGAVSRAELARATLALARHPEGQPIAEVEDVPTSAFPLPAARPAYAPLDGEKARTRLGVALPPWRESLARALADEERP